MASFFRKIRQNLTANTDEPTGQIDNVLQEYQTIEADKEDVENVVNEQSLDEGNQQVEPEEEVSPITQQVEPVIEPLTSQPEPNESKAAADEEEVASTIPDEPKPSIWRDDLYIQTRSKHV